MKVSVCLTVLNEENSVKNLIESLLNQSKSPDEIVIVDGGSTDATLSVISNFQLPIANEKTKFKVISKKCTRSKGRNIAVKKAKYEIVAMTDAGCVAKNDWLEKITKPFRDKKVEIVAGFYDMVGDSSLQKAETVFLGVMPNDFNDGFLPSTRSVAFRKSLWKGVKGFPEDLADTAEDTIFNYKVINNGVKIYTVKDARVEWAMPTSLGEFFKKTFNYSKGDIKSGVFIFPTKSLSSHNVKTLLKLFRYAVFIFLLIWGLVTPLSWWIFLFFVLVYFIWSFCKTYRYFSDLRVGMWGIILQLISDIAAISGLFVGIRH